MVARGDVKTERWYAGEENKPRNRKFVVKNCGHCGKEFGTDTPWRKHCGWACTYDHMQQLQRARRIASKARSRVTVTCVGCKQAKDDIELTVGRQKGICPSCMGLIESMGFDHAFAYRLGYIMREVFTKDKASRQGRDQRSRER